MKEIDILRKLVEKGMYITTKELDRILLEWCGNKYDAGMWCNLLMQHGFIDYEGDGDWEIFVTKEDLEDE